jgi:hypothetical protein
MTKKLVAAYVRAATASQDKARKLAEGVAQAKAKHRAKQRGSS